MLYRTCCHLIGQDLEGLPDHELVIERKLGQYRHVEPASILGTHGTHSFMSKQASLPGVILMRFVLSHVSIDHPRDTRLFCTWMAYLCIICRLDAEVGVGDDRPVGDGDGPSSRITSGVAKCSHLVVAVTWKNVSLRWRRHA